MAISKTQVNTMIIGLMASIALVVLLLPSSVNATVPNKTYTSKQDCKTRLAVYKNDELKTYGKARVDSRNKSLNSYESKMKTFYTTQENRIKRYEDSHKRTTGVNSNFSKGYLNDNKAGYINVINETRTKMNALSTTLQGSSSSAHSADAICTIMYDLRVNTYVGGKMKHLRMIDSSRTTATINNIRISESTKVYEKRKARYQNPASAEKSIKSLPRSLEFESGFADVTKKLNAISPGSINGNSPATANAEFLGYLPELNKLTEGVKTQTGTISKIRSDLKKEKLKPKPTVRRSSSNGNGGTQAR